MAWLKVSPCSAITTVRPEARLSSPDLLLIGFAKTQQRREGRPEGLVRSANQAGRRREHERTGDGRALLSCPRHGGREPVCWSLQPPETVLKALPPEIAVSMWSRPGGLFAEGAEHQIFSQPRSVWKHTPAGPSGTITHGRGPDDGPSAGAKPAHVMRGGRPRQAAWLPRCGPGLHPATPNLFSSACLLPFAPCGPEAVPRSRRNSDGFDRNRRAAP